MLAFIATEPHRYALIVLMVIVIMLHSADTKIYVPTILRRCVLALSWMLLIAGFVIGFRWPYDLLLCTGVWALLFEIIGWMIFQGTRNYLLRRCESEERELEDLALAEAIREGQKSKHATRADVFQVLQGKR